MARPTVTPSAPLRVAAVQLDAPAGDADGLLEQSERLVAAAARGGATWVVLPEFFATGIGFLPELSANAPPLDGGSVLALGRWARVHGLHLGGSLLVRHPDGHVRNSFLLFGPDGALLGRHDKDLPTMWENALYVGGEDDGRIAVGGLTIGVALCWELLRTATMERLAGQVDLVLGGSGWWSIPRWRPHLLFDRLEAANGERARASPAGFAHAVGSPMVHGAHAGALRCPMPWSPFGYRGHLEGGASISDGDGRVLGLRHREEGAGLVVADIEPRRAVSGGPRGYGRWFQPRGGLAALAWHYQRLHGRRHYRRNNPPSRPR